MHKIIYITYNLNTYSGAAYQALNLASHLQSDEEIVIFNFTKNQYCREGYVDRGVNVFDFNNSLLGLLRLLIKIIRYRIKVVHFHVFLTPVILVFMFLRKRIIIKTTMISDDDFDSLLKKTKYRFLKRLIFRFLSKNICLSKHAMKINSHYIPIDKIVNIPNGVELPEEVKIEQKEVNSFCYVGVICERKQTLEAIKYFHRNYSSLKDSILYIIGPNKVSDNVPEFDNEYYYMCQKYIMEYALNRQIIFVGKCSKDKLLPYYVKSKAFIFFSKKEGLPNVVLEAMSYNCVPIVSSMDGVAEEIIDVGYDGFILTGSFKEIINEDEINSIIKSGNCFNKIKNRFSINTICSNYKELYSGLK